MTLEARATERLQDRGHALPEWLTTSQVANLLGISGTHVRRLADEGHLRAKSTPYGRLYEAVSVVDWDRAREIRRRWGPRGRPQAD